MIPDKQQTINSCLLLFCYVPLLSATHLPMDPTSIHVSTVTIGLQLNELFVCVCVCVCMHICKLINLLSISMSVNATPAQRSLTQRTLRCVCIFCIDCELCMYILYWLWVVYVYSVLIVWGSMQHFYLWLISTGLQANWVLFDWALWLLVIKVGSWESIEHVTGNLTQFGRCSICTRPPFS